MTSIDNFEDGTYGDWEIHYGIVSYKSGFFGGKEKRRINWKDKRDDQPEPMIVGVADKLPQQLNPIPILEGQYMLRINDLVGDNHVTCAHKTITLPEDFHSGCCSLHLKWAALLQGSGHKGSDRPQFSVIIARKKKFRLFHKKDKTWKRIVGESFYAPDSSIDGWIDIKNTGETDAVWYKSGELNMSLKGYESGDQLRIRVVAEDCTAGAHGGCGFIDDVKILDGCTDIALFSGNNSIPDPIIPNVITPNGDGINDVWGLREVKNTCKIELYIYDRWGIEVYSTFAESSNADWPIFISLWNGEVKSHRNSKGKWRYLKKRKRTVSTSDGTMSYLLKLKNCNETRDFTGFIQVFT